MCSFHICRAFNFFAPVMTTGVFLGALCLLSLLYLLKIGFSGHSDIHFLGCRLKFFVFCLRHRHLNFTLPLFSFVLRGVLQGCPNCKQLLPSCSPASKKSRHKGRRNCVFRSFSYTTFLFLPRKCHSYNSEYLTISIKRLNCQFRSISILQGFNN